jgi:RNA polymerase sigma-70 factor (ECF subfamily)
VERDKFIKLIKDNQNLIFKICFSYCRNHSIRKDLEQEIFIQLWKSYDKFDGRVKASTWIYRIALNTAISFYRENTRYYGKKVDIDPSIISLSSIEYNPETDEKIILLYQFIDKLSAIDKALILLYLDENKYKEISEILGISETNVGTKINRIKKILKEQFGNT